MPCTPWRTCSSAGTACWAMRRSGCPGRTTPRSPPRMSSRSSWPRKARRKKRSAGTARPETMVGDTGVAVHPDDWRYRDLIGKSVTLPVVHRIVPIVADEAVDREFGTGAVKVTPGHDVTDYDIGERHHLPILTILHLDGRMNIPEVPQLNGLPVAKARPKIVELLR